MRPFRTYGDLEVDPAAAVPAQLAAQAERLGTRLESIGAVWFVASGKGGVGKSAITANLAAALAGAGRRVGALDGDVNGPSLGRMLGVERVPLRVDEAGVRPASGAGGVRVMSMDLMLAAEDSPVGWRGPGSSGDHLWQSTLETGALREFIADVSWGPLDLLLVDLAPGTDKLRRALELVPRPAGVLLVTTPAEASRFVVVRSARLLRELGAPAVGLVANMAGHVCAACGHADPLFGADGARRLAAESGLELWAEIPFHAELARSTDQGRPIVLHSTRNPAATALRTLARRIGRAPRPRP